jgi:DNA-directed RNA polymerase specialized sigma24 family protein
MSRRILGKLAGILGRWRRGLGLLSRAERDWVRRLEAAIAALPEPTRSVFELIRDRHLSYGDAASQLGLSEREVEAHVALALRSLATVPRERHSP